jgi:hypothetical protein
MPEEPFGYRMRLPPAHRAISLHQSLNDGPLDHAVAETKRPRSLRRAPVAADLPRNTARKSIENARQRWRMV